MDAVTTPEFERAQLRLDIDNIQPRYVIVGDVAEQVEATRQALQDYFERRD